MLCTKMHFEKIGSGYIMDPWKIKIHDQNKRYWRIAISKGVFHLVVDFFPLLVFVFQYLFWLKNKQIMENGWIKLYRQLSNKGWYQRSAYVHLWIHLLLKANHEGKEFFWNGQTICLMPGSFVTGRKQLHKETKIPETTIERILETFENGHQIGQQKNNKFRLITVLNWEKFQGWEKETDNKRTSSGHLADTNNNDNNINNIIKESIDAPHQEPPLDEIPFREIGDPPMDPIPEPGSKKRKDIDALLEKITKIVGVLDGSQRDQRNFAKHFLDSKIGKIFEEMIQAGKLAKDYEITEERKINSIARIFQIAKMDPFHKKNCRSIKYVYNNAGGIRESQNEAIDDTEKKPSPPGMPNYPDASQFRTGPRSAEEILKGRETADAIRKKLAEKGIIRNREEVKT